jgi:hypothetical protein
MNFSGETGAPRPHCKTCSGTGRIHVARAEARLVEVPGVARRWPDGRMEPMTRLVSQLGVVKEEACRCTRRLIGGET